MSESRNDIETFGIDKVRSILRKAKHLSPRLNDNEKSPGYDGYVSITNRPTDKIEDEIGRVFVQVKTRTRKKKQEKEKITYDIDKKYIDNYIRNYALIIFVVHRFEDDNYCVYYRELQKIDLFNLSKTGKERIPVEMRRLRKNPMQLDDLFIHFLESERIQEMIIPEHQVNISDIIAGGFKTHLKISTLHAEERNLFSIIKDGNVTLYGEKNNVLFYINSDGFVLNSVKTTKDCILSVGNKVFFNKAEVEQSENEVTYSFSDSIQIVIEHGEQKIVSLKYHIPEKMDSLILFMSFILSLIEVRFFDIQIDGKSVICNLNEIPSGLISFCMEQLPRIEKIKKMMILFGVDSDLDVFQVREHELSVACQVYDSVKDGTEVELFGHEEESILVYLVLGNLRLAFLAIKQESGKYRIWDELGCENRRNVVMFFPNEETGHLVPIETCFRDSAIWECDNFNRNIYLKTLNSLLANDSKLALIINDYDFLDILKSFDKCKKPSLLELALSIISIIKESKEGPSFDQMTTINYLQVIKRQRPLSEKERNELIDILSSDEPVYKIAACLLLDRKERAKELLRKIGDEDRERIMNYPISIFLK